jgi:hypothetical protein
MMLAAAAEPDTWSPTMRAANDTLVAAGWLRGVEQGLGLAPLKRHAVVARGTLTRITCPPGR